MNDKSLYFLFSNIKTFSDDEGIPHEIFERDYIYDKFSFVNYIQNRDLPIFDSKKQISDALAEHQIIVIDGSTGCGKSTQVIISINIFTIIIDLIKTPHA